MATSKPEIIDCFGEHAAALLKGTVFGPADHERLLGRLIELRQLGTALSRELSPAQVAATVLDRTLMLLGADSGTISWTVEPDTLSMLYARNVPAEWIASFERFSTDAPLPESEAYRTGEPVWLEDEDDLARRYPAALHAWRAARRPTSASIPFILDGLPVGVLGLTFGARRRVDTLDRAFALALAQECANALERARLYEEERLLRDQAEHTRALLDAFIANIPTGLAFFDRDLRYVRVNRALAAMNGLPAEAHVGRRVREILPVPGWAAEIDAIEALLRGALDVGAATPEHAVSIEHPPGSGRKRHWVVGVYPVRTRSGAILGAGASVRDVTVLREVEDARERVVADLGHALESLHASEALVDSVYDHAPIGLGLLDLSLRFVRVNRTLAEMNGLPPEVHLGRTPRELLPNVPMDAIEASWRRVLETGQPLLGVELSAETPAAPGHVRHWVEDWYPVRVEGKIIGLGVVVRDVTEQKATEQLQRLLVGIVGHDLRNPLGVIATSARLLEANGLDARQRQTVARIARATDSIRSLAQILLDYTVFREGKRMSIAPRDVELAEVLDAVLDDFRAVHPDRPVHADVSGEGRVSWDVERVRRLIENLLSNAAKYGDRATPIAIRCRGTPADVTIEIENRGPSIPPDRLPHIFEPLQQVGDADRRAGGIGLGLFIARQIVEAHGGEIEARSTDGTTAFTVRLPRQVPAETPRL